MYCKICNKEIEFKRISDFIKCHIIKLHNSNSKDYYDMFLKKDSNDGKCKICGKDTNFINLQRGYTIYCSKNCKSIDNDYILNKRKSTNIEKYGAEYNFLTEEFKQKTKETLMNKFGVDNIYKCEEIINKRKATNIDKYQAETPFESSIIQNKVTDTVKQKYNCTTTLFLPEVKAKILNTCLTKYGYECNYSNKTFKQIADDTVYKKYGVKSTLSVKEIHQKTINNRSVNNIENFKTILNNINYKLISYGLELNLKCDCNHDFKISRQQFFRRLKANYTICTICNPLDGVSNVEKSVVEFIRSIYNEEIIENSIDILNAFELDIYLPKLKLAIEFNGLFWHNELHKDKNYHLFKTTECERLGIQLIHIYEDDWIYKQEIIKSRLLNLLGLSTTIYARKCIVKQITTHECNSFLDKNHLQGKINSSYQFGLFYEDMLISVMCFGKLRKNLGQKHIENNFELLRFCNILGVSVVGGANKLLKHFIKTIKPKTILSYADRSWTIVNSNIYDKLGFKFMKYTSPNYYYIKNDLRLNRFNFRKDVLIKEGFDPNKTEREIMLDRKLYRIYDSGQLKYILNLT